MTETLSNNKLPFMKSVCYSGFRRGQSPDHGVYPSCEEILEDLRLLEVQWDCIRIYDGGVHGQRVLKVIHDNKLDLKVLLGTCLAAEVNNPSCPWGGEYPDHVLSNNQAENNLAIETLAILANRYKDIVVAVSVGNEATVEWNDHMVPVERVTEFVQRIKGLIKQPVTFCENYIPWQNKLADLVEVVDFISLHTYPLWEYQKSEKAIAFTNSNYMSVKSRYPDKQVVITEAGWATGSNGRGMPEDNASEKDQAIYCRDLMAWSEDNQVTVYLFEAFDEDWKGSEDPMEPEKHWGLYDIERKPKSFIKHYSHTEMKEEV